MGEDQTLSCDDKFRTFFCVYIIVIILILKTTATIKMIITYFRAHKENICSPMLQHGFYHKQWQQKQLLETGSSEKGKDKVCTTWSGD